MEIIVIDSDDSSSGELKEAISENMEVIVIDSDDSSSGELEEAISVNIASNFRSLHCKNQLQKIDQLRKLLHINDCPLVYNPKSSFEFNLALKINSIDFEAFKKSEESLENLIAVGNSVIRVYKDCDSKSWLSHVIEKISKSCVEPSDDVEKFFCKLWDMKKELFFPSSIVEMVAFSYPSVLEDLVIHLVTQCYETNPPALQRHLDEVFNDDDVKSWISLCAKCPRMFQLSCSMIQTLLHYSRGDRTVLAFARSFHQAIRGRCNVYHQLFPGHLKLLVRRLETKTPGDDKVLNDLLDLMVNERPACQALLTCFPLWLPRLLVFAVNNGLASAISEEFGDWHT